MILTILFVFSTSFVFAQSKSAERTSVDLTIYNQNLSLIREERTMKLAKGTSRVVVPDIPQTIDGTSVHFLSMTAPDAVKVLEQNYQYDLVNQNKLMEKYIGKKVEFVRLDELTKKEFTVEGTILSIHPLVAEVKEKIEISPAGRLVLPSLPEGLILRPQLEWLVSNTKEGEHKTEISYLAGQLSWSCNYVVLLNKVDTKLDMTGWVTLTNNSGTTFKDAGLKLVAGDVNIVRQQFEPEMRGMMAMKTMDAAEPQFKQTDLFEYKLYSLQRKTDLKDNETKQIELTSGKNVASKKVFIYDGMANEWRWYRNNHSYRSQGSFGQQSNPKVGVFVTFKNEKESGLGIALPKGKVRVYKRDDDGKEQFIGEDEIDHTPKDEELRLYLGNAFDIVGERVQKDFKSFSSGRVVEETIELKVRNHKNEAAEVLIYEHPWRWSDWEITKSNTEWQKVDQSTLKFPVKIAKDGEKVVTYTIRYSW
ncbi:MAG: hypothetical protein HYZ34_10305 [Ignavibacteriae bacterium]|nr:hypothetical protein [Ignavibacteriota bacterium]